MQRQTKTKQKSYHTYTARPHKGNSMNDTCAHTARVSFFYSRICNQTSPSLYACL